MDYTLNVKGRLMSLSEPRVMGIINVTPDSFFADSRRQTQETIAQRVRQMVADGADIIDVGACSTRPGAALVSTDDEVSRLRLALPVVRTEAPATPLSIDTFRPDVARMAVEEYGADIINDVQAPASLGPQPSTPTTQPPLLAMYRMVSRLGVPYVLMASQPTIRDMLLWFAKQVQLLRDMGQKDIILDPGFGFGKTLQTTTDGQGYACTDTNYDVMSHLEQLLVMQLPLLVGVSRKSMICRLLGTTPDGALNGTTVLNTMALLKGASILRVHDVREAVECVKIFKQIRSGE